MLKQRLIALLTGLALILAVAGASAGVAHNLATDGAVQTIACNTGGGSGGGC